MQINIKLKNDVIVGYRTFPIDLNEEYVEVENIPLDILSGDYTCREHKLCKKNSLVGTNDMKKTYEKDSLEQAFNQYKNDVFYGKVIVDKDVHQKVLLWHDELENSVGDSLSNPPKEILAYMGEEK
ncbi:MAG: hypothetical protein K2M08_05320 [Anaeroplasmataceae bacterium]|nr:hypothetical protein [Anaeroplasmataceae bacterium]